MAGTCFFTNFLHFPRICVQHGRVRQFKSVKNGLRSHTTSVDAKAIEVEKMGAVTLIGINRPDKRNAVDSQTAEDLMTAVAEFEDDPDSRVGVIHGKGGNFCAGYDLSELADGKVLDKFPPSDDNSGRGPMGPTRRVIKKPLVAAVSGYAVAGGFELALMCDLRVVEESAIMGVFCRRFGVPLLDGGTVRLPQLIGLSHALDLILTGRAVSAKEAEQIGLANRVVATGSALGQAIHLAHCIAKFPQKCMNADRLSAYNSTYSATSQKEAFQFELEKSKLVLTEESIEGAGRFVSGVGRKGSFNSFKPRL